MSPFSKNVLALLTCAAALLPIPSPAQVWIRQFGSPAPPAQIVQDIPLAIAVDATGIYVGGATSGNLFQTKAHPFGDNDIFIAKFDKAGNLLWGHQVDSGAEESASAVAADGSGAYVVGSTAGSLFGPRIGTGYTDYDGFIAKYAPDGSVLWSNQFSVGQNTRATSVTADARGVYVAGSYDTSPNNWVMFLRKYDTKGALLSSQLVCFSGYNVKIATDTTGLYFVGRTLSTTNPGYTSAFLRKYDFSGNLLWSSPESGVFPPSGPADVNVSADGSNAYMVGTGGQFGSPFVRKYSGSGALLWSQTDTAYGSATAVVANPTGAFVTGYFQYPAPDTSKAFLRRFDSAGAVLWTQQLAQVGDSTANGVAVDSTGAYMTGQTSLLYPHISAYLARYDLDLSVAGTPSRVTPSYGNGSSQWFQLAYGSSAGGASIGGGGVLFNTSLDGRSACWVYYDRAQNTFSLASDNAATWTTMRALSAGTLSNSQCTVNGGSAALFSNGLQVSLWLTFKPSFSGNKYVYLYGTDNSGKPTSYSQLGTWIVP